MLFALLLEAAAAAVAVVVVLAAAMPSSVYEAKSLTEAPAGAIGPVPTKTTGGSLLP